MTQQPLVSIIIPCYNSQAYIADAINSALNQTYSNLEVVVVDDGSTDDSVNIIKSFGDRLKFEQSEHKGACAARNKGLSISQGEYIQFLDADDLLIEHKIETQLPFLLQDEADLVFCKGYIFGDGKGIRAKKSEIKSPEGIDPFIYCLDQGLSTEGPLHRRSLLEKVGAFNETLPRAQELEMHVKLGAVNTRILLLNELLYQHRHHDGPRITKRKMPENYMLFLYIDLAKSLLENTDTYDMTPTRIQAIANKIFQQSIYTFRNGDEESAQVGFQYAMSIGKNLQYSEPLIYGLLRKIIGPLRTEKILKQGRLLKKYKNSTS